MYTTKLKISCKNEFYLLCDFLYKAIFFSIEDRSLHFFTNTNKPILKFDPKYGIIIQGSFFVRYAYDNQGTFDNRNR